MFAYAAGMIVVILIFSLMSIFYYEYVDYTNNEEDEKTLLTKESPSLSKNYDAVSENIEMKM